MRKCRSWISICLVFALLLTMFAGVARADQIAVDAYSAPAVSEAPAAQTASVEEKDPFTASKASPWCVYGTMNGSNWDKGLPMVEVGDEVYEISLVLNAGEELKVHRRDSWETNYGAFGVFQGSNLIVPETGRYTVRLSFPDEAELELIPAWKNSCWSIIGTVDGTNWDTDLPMEEVADGYYTLELDLFAGEELKVRKDRSWEMSFGADGELGGENLVVSESGRYMIRLLLTGKESASLQLVPVSSSFEQTSGWSVIGNILGTNWNRDFPLHPVGEGRFESDKLSLHAGEELKVRKDGSWTVNYGLDGYADGDNFKVARDGDYYMLLAFHEGYGEPAVQLLPVSFSQVAGKIREVKARLEEKYPVRFYIDPTQPYASDYECVAHPEPITVCRMLLDLEEFFDALPPGFLTELHDGVPSAPEEEGSRIVPGGRLRFYLVQEIIGSAAALTNMYRMTVCFGAKEFSTEHIPHEFMHLIDARILKTLSAAGRNWDKEWEALSPNHAYDENYSNRSVIADYFVTDYARSEVAEDKAETFMTLWMSSEPLSKASWYKGHSGIQAKVACLIRVIREVFPSVRATTRAPWEKH